MRSETEIREELKKVEEMQSIAYIDVFSSEIYMLKWVLGEEVDNG